MSETIKQHLARWNALQEELETAISEAIEAAVPLENAMFKIQSENARLKALLREAKEEMSAVEDFYRPDWEGWKLTLTAIDAALEEE